MRNLMVLCLWVSCSSLKSYGQSQSEVYGTYGDVEYDTNSVHCVRMYVTDLNNDFVPDTISLELLNDLAGDPETYSQLRLKLSGRAELLFLNLGGYYVDSTSRILAGRTWSNDQLVVVHYSVHSFAIVCWGYQYPSCHTQFSVILVDGSDAPAVFTYKLHLSELRMEERLSALQIEAWDFCTEEKQLILIPLP